MDWNDLQYFLAVQQAGSLSAAARTLGVNHSTVLRRLAHLETSLGVALFQRLPGGYVPSAAGEELLEQLAGIGERIEGAQRRLQGKDLEIRGTIRLTSTDTLFGSLLTPLLVAFQQAHPQVRLQLVTNNAFLSLTRREADVAVRGSNHPPDNLLGRRVGRIQTAAYAARRYLTGKPAGLPWAEHLWVGPDEALGHLDQARWLAAHVPSDRVLARLDSLVGMLECVRQGLGAGLLLCPLADAQAELVRLAEPSPALDTDIWVLTHPDLRHVARIKALTDFLYQHLSTDPRLVH